MTNTKDVFLNMIKQDIIDLLDELESGVDHSELQGKVLIAVKKKHHIGPLKNKNQLVDTQQKAAREVIVEKIKQEAVEAAKKEGKKVL